MLTDRRSTTLNYVLLIVAVAVHWPTLTPVTGTFLTTLGVPGFLSFYYAAIEKLELCPFFSLC